MGKGSGIPMAKSTMRFDQSSKEIIQAVTSQRNRFIEAARSIGADEDEAAFKAKLAVVARQKPGDNATGEKSDT